MLFAILAVLDLTAVAADVPALEWIVKPLLAPVLAGWVWLAPALRARPARLPAVIGLGWAALGDTVLLVEGTVAFLAGLACFLVMQVCYLVAFHRAGRAEPVRTRRWVAVAYLTGWIAALTVLTGELGLLMLAVAPYGLVLFAMATAADRLGNRAALGGLLFVVSDLLIGLGAADGDFPGRGLLVMTTYIAAQALLITALARHHRRADGG